MTHRFLAALALACALSSPALADPACDSQFLDGKRPVVAVPAGEGGVELCNDSYVTFWSPRTRDPIYSAERLTSENLTKADHEARDNDFHADVRLPKGDRAELSDYAGGEYDRGHQAPAHDMPTPEAMHQSFLLSNMAPQVPALNRGPWAQDEIFVRRLAVLGGGAYVVTGPMFGEKPRHLNGRVAIPSGFWKAVYVPPSQFNPDGQVGVYVAPNRADAEVTIISLDALKAEVGVDPFPSLSPEQHAKATLPAVAAH